MPPSSAEALSDLGFPRGTQVNLAGIINHDGTTEVHMRNAPNTGAATVIRSLPFNTGVQVLRAPTHGWSFVSTRDGQLGYVASPYIWTDLPEPTARLHRVQSGLAGAAIAIAEQYYAQESYDWGQDLRYYVNVLAYANKKQVPADEGWRDVSFLAGNMIWVPGRRYADSLTGVVDSGSLSYGVLSPIVRAFVRLKQACEDIAAAVTLSLDYLGPAIERHVVKALWDSIKSLALLVVGAIGILAASTAVGAGVGALAGGVGAAPGAAAGFEVGLALLDWLGLGMLAAWLVGSLRDVGVAFGTFIATAWGANGNRAEIVLAAQQFAEAVGKLFGTLTEALLMFAAAKGMGAVVNATRGSRFGRVVGDKPFMKWFEKSYARYKNKWESPLRPPGVVLGRVFRGVEIVDGGKCSEFDGVDVARRQFIENKTANDLGKINPKTGKPFNNDTPADWAQKHIVAKTRARLKLLATATATRPTVGGSPDVPSITEIQGFKRLHFRIDATSSALRSAVAQSLATLKTEYPGWEFTAEFGADILLPPVAGSDDH